MCPPRPCFCSVGYHSLIFYYIILPHMSRVSFNLCILFELSSRWLSFCRMDIDYSPTGREFVTGSYDRTVSSPLSFMFFSSLSTDVSFLLIFSGSILSSCFYCRWEYFHITGVTVGKYITQKECKGMLALDQALSSFLLPVISWLWIV